MQQRDQLCLRRPYTLQVQTWMKVTYEKRNSVCMWVVIFSVTLINPDVLFDDNVLLRPWVLFIRSLTSTWASLTSNVSHITTVCRISILYIVHITSTYKTQNISLFGVIPYYALWSFLYYVTFIKCACTDCGKVKGYSFNNLSTYWVLKQSEDEKNKYLKEKRIGWFCNYYYCIGFCVGRTPNNEEKNVKKIQWLIRYGSVKGELDV